MKKYQKPKIIAVELDSKQAILSVCAVGGMYINTTNGPNMCVPTIGPGVRCSLTPKGNPTTQLLGSNTITDASPS